MAALVGGAALMGALGIGSRVQSATASPSPAMSPVKIAVFEVELEDASPSAALLKEKTTSDDSLRKVTVAAREELVKSGRYTIVSVDGAQAKPVKEGTLRQCEGCESAIARDLGAQQSMIGVVQRATQTDYYMMVVIRDAATGKVLNAQDANFAGGEEGWPTGIRMLIKHQVLAQ